MKFFRDNPVIAFSLALHLIVPFYSFGYLHPDEQFYSIEFMLLKMGIADHLTFPWEYDAQIRPFSLPFFFYGVGSFFKLLGLNDVFTLSTVLRVISSLLGFTSLYFFIETWKKKYSIHKTLEWVFYLAWPLVLMHSRTNSENWSTSFYLVGISLLLRNRSALFSGIILGLSFYFRFQLGFLILPVYWFWRKELGKLSLMTVGIFITCGLMILVDRWGYGFWTLTPWNYVMVNLVQDKVSGFGTSPWWYYFYKILIKLVPFWGLAILGSLVWGFRSWSREFKEILIWIMPFFMIHILIGHKELRFLYPIMPFCMILAARFIGELKGKWQKVFIWGNILALPILFIPRTKRFIIYDYVFKNKDIKTLYWATSANPLHIKSMVRKDLIFKDFKEYSSGEPFYVITHNYGEYSMVENEYACEIKKEIYPAWIRKFNIGNWVSRASTWVLGYCEAK